MKHFNWQITFGISLVLASLAVYLVHFIMFRDVHHILIYLVGDIAFVFMEVLLVTLVIHKLLGYREKQTVLKKKNMVIGAFFSEMGNELIGLLVSFDKNSDILMERLVLGNGWSEKDFLKAGRFIKACDCDIKFEENDLERLKAFLIEKKGFILRLLENPILLEHESFTDLLWAVSHLTEELANRKRIKHLSQNDNEHLTVDTKRAYLRVIGEWLNYMKHLKIDYPYLFSLAVRTNPFNETACVEIK